MADGLAHAPHLALAALVQHDLDDARAARRAQHAHPRRRSAPAVQLDARGQPRSRLGAHRASHRRLVRLLDAVARVHEPRREVAVVREQQQPGRVGVEPAHGEEPAVGADEIDHRAPAVRVPHRRDDVRGLVEQHVRMLVRRDGASVERDGRACRDALPGRCRDDAVDRDASRLDERLHAAARAETAGCEVAIEARGLGGHRGQPRSAATACSRWRSSALSSSSLPSRPGRPAIPSSRPKMRSNVVVVR